MIDRDDIIKLAREAGFREPNPHDGCMGLAFDYRGGTDTGASLERFAALVAKNEREACAKACEEHPEGLNMLGGHFVLCAQAIRARGET